MRDTAREPPQASHRTRAAAREPPHANHRTRATAPKSVGATIVNAET